MKFGNIWKNVKTRFSGSDRVEPASGVFGELPASSAGRAGRFRLGARRVAVDAVSGAIRVADEITGEATGFVRDAVIGVIEGRRAVAKLGKPFIRDVVSAAVLTSSELGGNVREAIRQSVEGAVMGARDPKAGAQASVGVAEAARDLNIDFADVVSPAIHGVVTGVIATDGNLFDATSDIAYSLLESASGTDHDPVGVSHLILNQAIQASRAYGITSTDVVMGAAQGCIRAGYDIDRETGDAVHASLVAVVDAPLNTLAPLVRGSVVESITELAADLRARPHGWRGVVLWRAVKTLVHVGGIDSSAALAYYSLLAFFPLVALMVLALSIFWNPDSVRGIATEILLFYFPGLEEYLLGAIDYMLNARLVASLIAVAGIAVGTMGLFVAANRGVNLVFGCPPKKLLGATVSTIGITLLAILLFMVSIGLTAVFQLALNLAERLPAIGAQVNWVLFLVTSVASGVVPPLVGGLVFVITYKRFPNVPVQWRDATFGGFVTVIIFEATKHLFFWFANFSSHRSILYGSVSSVVLILIWSQVAGLIFLYGAALTKHATDLRPRSDEQSRFEDEMRREEARRANIRLGRTSRRDWRGNGDDFGPTNGYRSG